MGKEEDGKSKRSEERHLHKTTGNTIRCLFDGRPGSILLYILLF